MFRARSCTPPRQNLASVGDEPAHQLGILEIYFDPGIRTEKTDFTSTWSISTAFSLGAGATSASHGLMSPFSRSLLFFSAGKLPTGIGSYLSNSRGVPSFSSVNHDASTSLSPGSVSPDSDWDSISGLSSISAMRSSGLSRD